MLTHSRTLVHADGAPPTNDLERARTAQTTGADKCLLIESRFGIGFMTPSSSFATLLGPGSFGHPGAGGSLGCAQPEHELALGYVMNQMQMNLAEDPRVKALTDAALACVGA